MALAENEFETTLKVGAENGAVVVYLPDGNYLRMPPTGARSFGFALLARAAEAEGTVGGHVFTFLTEK